MTKTFVSGCAGFIGFHLSKFFLEKGHKVVGLDNLSRKGSKINLEYLLKFDNFNFYNSDIRNFEDLKDIFNTHKNFQLIIHQAAQVAVTTSITNPRNDFETNILGTFNLLEATRLYSPNAVFQYASTNKVYGEMNKLTVIKEKDRYDYKDQKKGIHENFPIDFHSPYGCSKGSADQYVRDYHRIYGLKTMVLRQSCIYGTNQYGLEEQGWIAWFIIGAILEKKLNIYGDGFQGRDVLWIDDLVNAYEMLYLNSDKTSGEIFNIGGGYKNVLSINKLITYLDELNLLKVKPKNEEWRPGDQKIYISDITKINELTGWSPKINPKIGVEKLTEWCRNNNQLFKIYS